MPFNNAPTVRASVLAVLAEYTHARGVDVKALMKEVGIDHRSLKSPDTYLPLKDVGRLFEQVARSLDDPAFGLSYAKIYPPGASGLLGHLILTAPTVRDVFLVLTRYIQVHTTTLVPAFEMRDGVGWFTFSWPASVSEPLVQYTAFSIASLVLRLRRAAGPTWVPLRVEFQHRPPQAIAAYRELFGPRLKFDRSANRMAIDAPTLSRPMPEILPMLAQSLKELGDRQLSEVISEQDVAAQLQQILVKRLEREQSIDLDSVADELGMANRRLQWRLAQQATTYENVLLLTRMLLAERYLRDNNFNLTRIASLLGFAELSVFTRWCQRHFTKSPSAYRRLLRSEGSSTTLQDAPRA